MRRYGDCYPDVYGTGTLIQAAKKACSSRKNRREVERFQENQDVLLDKLQRSLIDHTYKSSEYRIFQVHENGKVRDVADLPLYPDRICHWAIALAIEDKVCSKFIDQTHASRPKHGIHSAVNNIKGYLRKDKRLKYCLKLDVKKFFPSIDKIVMKRKFRDVFKDRELLIELDKIVDQYPYPGIAIGNRVSPMFANLYLSEIDHLMKEKYHVHYYERYMDDIIILGYSKPWLHKMRETIASYLSDISLTLKENWQVFPIDSRGIDFVGYRIYTDHVLLRERNKKKLTKACERIQDKLDDGGKVTRHDRGTLASYNGLLKWCDGHHLYQKTIGETEKKIEEKRIERRIAFAMREIFDTRTLGVQYEA